MRAQPEDLLMRFATRFAEAEFFMRLKKTRINMTIRDPFFGPPGASLIVRKSHYLAVGGLDESLFAHMKKLICAGACIAKISKFFTVPKAPFSTWAEPRCTKHRPENLLKF